MEVMDWFLKRRLMLFSVIVMFLVVGFFFFRSDCDEKSVEVKAFVNKLNHSSEGAYHVYLDQCYLEAHIVNRSDNVDSALFHSFLARLIQIEKRNYFVNIYNRDSMLLYVEYAGYSNGDTTYHKVAHYEY
ncbi:MAG: hypothetical protein ACK5QX_12010 [bacterium]|jgi:hypothetical protein